MFITGVSPVTMDDVTSGFNIGRNISLHPAFNKLLGFTKQDVIELLEYYLPAQADRDNGMFSPHTDETLRLMKERNWEWALSTCTLNPFCPNIRI